MSDGSANGLGPEEETLAEARAKATIAGLHAPLELPILDEMDAAFRARLADARREDAAAPRRTPAGRRRRTAGATGPRLARRTVITALLLLALGASALAASTIVGGGGKDDGPTTAPTTMTSGADGRARYELDAYRHQGDVCVALDAGGVLASACRDAPAAGRAVVLSSAGPASRFVAGLAGPGVARVTVRVGGRVADAPTHPPPDAKAARRASLPGGLRWFLVRVPLAATTGAEPPARVTPYDGRGRATGPTVLDCTLGAASTRCRRAPWPRSAP